MPGVSWYTQIYRSFVCILKHKKYIPVVLHRQLCRDVHPFHIAKVAVMPTTTLCISRHNWRHNSHIYITLPQLQLTTQLAHISRHNWRHNWHIYHVAKVATDDTTGTYVTTQLATQLTYIYLVAHVAVMPFVSWLYTRKHKPHAYMRHTATHYNTLQHPAHNCQSCSSTQCVQIHSHQRNEKKMKNEAKKEGGG